MSAGEQGTRWKWGVKPEDQPEYKRPRTCQWLNETLMDFPDPDTLNTRQSDGSASTKLEDTVFYLRDIHKEQRRRLLERHTARYEAFKKDVELSIDSENTFKNDFSSGATADLMVKETYEKIHGPLGEEALKLLPAKHRNVWVSYDQIKHPPGVNDSSEREYVHAGMSSVQFAAEMASQGVEERRKMVNEEINMRMFHLSTMELYYTSLARNYPHKYGPNAPKPALPVRKSGDPLRKPPPPSHNWPQPQRPGQERMDWQSTAVSDTVAERATDPRRNSLGLGISVQNGPSKDTRPPPDPRRLQQQARAPQAPTSGGGGR